MPRDTVAAMTRRCWVCKVTKPLTGFYRDKSKPLGRHRECKSCAAERAKRRHRDFANHRAKMLAKRDPRYLARRKAKEILHGALKRGAMKRRPCAVCRRIPAEAHHDDYSKPLKVRWLCRQHHHDHHRAMRAVDALLRAEGKVTG